MLQTSVVLPGGDFFSSFLRTRAEFVEPLEAAESSPRCRGRFNATKILSVIEKRGEQKKVSEVR